MKNLHIAAVGAALLTALCASAAIPSGYYSGLEGKSGVSLKRAVKAAAQYHTAISYGNGSWEVFLESDTRIIGGQRVWWDMYSSNNVAAPNASSHSGMNIEHGVPNSWWGKTNNNAYKDLFHLNPSDSEANSRKGNYPLGEIAQQTWSNGVTFVGHPTSTTGDDASLVYEPADEYKGDFARAYFYMFTIYDDIAWTSSWDWMYNTSSDLLLRPWAYEMLLRWAKEDPVSQKEIDRNEAIYKHQKNRNPFIDFPELAEYIWGSKKNSPFHLDGSYDGPDDPDPDDPDDPDTPTGPTTPSGYWYAVTSTADLAAGYDYVVVATASNVVMSVDNAGKYFQVCQRQPSIDAGSSPSRLSGIPTDAAILRLEKSGAGWRMKVSDSQGNEKGYIKSTGDKELALTSSPSDNGTTVSITCAPAQTTMSYTYSNKTSSVQYNKSAPRFTTYASQQEPVQLYRLQPDGGTNGLGTGLQENEDEVIYGIYDLGGRRVSTGSLDGLDGGIYIVVSNFGTKKIVRF